MRLIPLRLGSEAPHLGPPSRKIFRKLIPKQQRSRSSDRDLFVCTGTLRSASGFDKRPLSKGSNPFRFLAPVHDFDDFATSVGCTGGVVITTAP
jgi:hypothetical protein